MSPTQVTIERILVPTLVIEPGMHVRDVFVACNRAHIQALPYRDQRGRLSGRVPL